jgi:tetratricopeptide (TPR) repeat protein
MKPSLFLLSIALLYFACTSTPETSRVGNQSSATPSTEKPAKSSFDYMNEASAAYSRGDYRGAIPLYEQALEMEKRDPQLEKEIWYVLVDNLAMAHGISGDLKSSRLVLDYGISKDSKYAMFHYILACTYGEEGDEANALRHLSTAYKNRVHVMKGEELPDPLADSSFASFADSESFKKAVANMKRARPVSLRAN